MENFIESRVILGMLCLIHLFANYASSVSWGHINRKVLNGVILTELIAVTAYIIYDNLQTPPHDGWFIAIVGYLFVYALIIMTRLGYDIYAKLDDDKTYEMTISDHVIFMNRDYFRGTVLQNNEKVTVLLPYEQQLDPANEVDNPCAIKTQNVKFDNVLRGIYILVKLA